MALKRVLISLAGLALAACGGSGNLDGPTVDGGVVKGPVSGATVCVYRLVAGSKGEQIPVSVAAGAAGSISGGCYVTPADGSYSFRLPRGTTGDLLVEATGGTFCSNEEVLAGGACPGGGTPVALGSSVMSSVASVQSNAGATVYTTPLTTAAVNNSRARGMTAANFAGEFSTLAGQILGPTHAATPSQRPTRSNQRFLLEVADFLKNGGTLTNAMTSLAKGTTTFAGGTTAPGGTTGGGNPPANTTPATIASALVGSYNLVFNADGAGCAGAGCSFSDKQTVTVVVHGDNRLELPGGKILTNPYYRIFGANGPNQHEIIWLDTAGNVEYGLSDNQGQFSEINLGDMTKPQPGGFGKFLGQMRKPQAAGDAAVAALAGTYTMAYQYRGAHTYTQWSSVTIGTDGAITFTGGPASANHSITAQQITQIFPCIAQCGTIRINHSRDLDGNPQTAHAFTLHLNANGGLRALSWDPNDENSVDDSVGVALVPQGQTLAALQHSGAAIPVTNAISGTVGTATLSFAAAATSDPALANAITLDASGGATGPSWRINLFPGGSNIAPGTYHCRKTATMDITIQATLTAGGFPVSTLNGGRCTIEVVTADTNGAGGLVQIRGRFTAEMYEGGRSNGPARTVVDGVFRWISQTID